jgi:FkbM family methyltransferase
MGTPRRPLDARHISGYRISCDLRDSVQGALFYCGTYEPQTTALISDALRPGETFLDVGANVGHYTFVAAKRVGLAGRVVAIEASRSTAERLAADVERNNLSAVVTVHNVAAGDHRSTSRLYAADDPAQVGMRHLDPGASHSPIEEVAVLPLDQLLPGLRPNVVKMDIEGAELRALSGMSKMLSTDPPRLVVAEAQGHLLRRFGDSAEAMIAFMGDRKYRAEWIGERWHSDSIAFRIDRAK